MTQLIVTIGETGFLSNLKKIIKLLPGVDSVEESVTCDKEEVPNNVTVSAIEAARAGDVLHCESFEDFKELLRSV